VHEDHGVLSPRLARRLVANAAPEIDDLFAVAVDAARRPELVAPGEVLEEGVAYALEALAGVSLDSSQCDSQPGDPCPLVRERERKPSIARGAGRDLSEVKEGMHSRFWRSPPPLALP
jgi:hypothetical protein